MGIINTQRLVDRKSAVWQTIRAWPKIDLHRHLEGALRLTTLFEIAQEYKIPLPAHDLDELRPHVQMVETDDPNFAVFLSKFGVLRQFFRSHEIIRRTAYEAVEDAARDNVKYLELRFTPNALARHNGYSYEDAVACVCEAAAQASREFNIQVRLIVSVNRHESVAIAERTLAAALDFRSSGIVGMDLAGLEVGHSAEPFQHVLRHARREGLGLTIHAGEWAGAQNIHDAITEIGANRIGHGVRITENERVLDLVRKHRIPLELCPTSNLHTGAVRDLDAHPLAGLHRLGVPVTINTDDPSLSNIVLTDELALSHVRLGLSLEALKAITLNAAQAAFLPDDERAALVARFDAALTFA